MYIPREIIGEILSYFNEYPHLEFLFKETNRKNPKTRIDYIYFTLRRMLLNEEIRKRIVNCMTSYERRLVHKVMRYYGYNTTKINLSNQYQTRLICHICNSFCSLWEDDQGYDAIYRKICKRCGFTDRTYIRNTLYEKVPITAVLVTK